MNHGLFVAEQVVRQSGVLFQGLAQPSNVSVPEDSQASFKQAVVYAIPFRVLVLEEGHDGLRDGQAGGHETKLHKGMPLKFDSYGRCSSAFK